MMLIKDGYLSMHLHGKTVSAVVGCVWMLLSPCTMISLNSIKKIQLRMVYALFNCNSCTTIISCYSPTNAGDKTDIIPFYNELSSFVWHIPKHWPSLSNRYEWWINGNCKKKIDTLLEISETHALNDRHENMPKWKQQQSAYN